MTKILLSRAKVTQTNQLNEEEEEKKKKIDSILHFMSFVIFVSFFRSFFFVFLIDTEFQPKTRLHGKINVQIKRVKYEAYHINKSKYTK